MSCHRIGNRIGQGQIGRNIASHGSFIHANTTTLNLGHNEQAQFHRRVADGTGVMKFI